jgi:hypothetical protein
MKRLVWIALTLAACGKSSDSKSSDGTAGRNAPSGARPPATAPSEPAAAGPQDRCEVHVTGARTVDIIGTKPRGAQDGKVSAGTEYWLSDGELRSALGTFVRLGGDKLSKADVERKIDEGMKKDPRLWLLLLNCKTDAGFLNLSASNGSTSKDVPFGPHSYVISSDPKAGELGAMFMLEQGKSASYHLAAPGKLEITKFDPTGLVGTFGFDAESRDGGHVTVKGSFDFGCSGGKCK